MKKKNPNTEYKFNTSVNREVYLLIHKKADEWKMTSSEVVRYILYQYYINNITGNSNITK